MNGTIIFEPHFSKTFDRTIYIDLYPVIEIDLNKKIYTFHNCVIYLNYKLSYNNRLLPMHALVSNNFLKCRKYEHIEVIRINKDLMNIGEHIYKYLNYNNIEGMLIEVDLKGFLLHIYEFEKIVDLTNILYALRSASEIKNMTINS